MGKTRSLFKETGDIKETFHERMGTREGRNAKDLTETKKRWQEYTELYKRSLNDLDNYDGVVTHPQPGIPECEVKWALGNTTMNRVSGGDGIPGELFQILNGDAVKLLHSIHQQIWKTQQWSQNWKRSVFIPIPKKGNAKECSNYHTVALISHASKVKLARECPDVQAGFRKAEELEIKLPTLEKARGFQKSIYFCFTDDVRAFDNVNHNKLWKILKEMGIPDYLICLLRNLYADQEATVRTGHGTMDWLQIGKGVHQSYILSPYLFNLYAEYIMRNAELDESQAGIKIARRNMNNLRYADDTTLMAEREEELKSLLMKVKEKSEKSWLKTQHSKS